MIITNNLTLKYIFMKDEILKGRKGWWMIYLQQFDFKIKHRAGKKMPYMDYLSRSSVEHQMLYELEELIEETFIG